MDYANRVGAVIIYDAAYEAYISEDNVPHTIYECEGARTCAIELKSFSKNAGFTGTRLGYSVVPKDLKSDGVSLHSLWARRHGTKYNGAPYIIQRAGEAVYSCLLYTSFGDAMEVSALITEGLGGRDNISDVDCCATRLRVTVHDEAKVDELLLKESGAAGVIRRGKGIQVVYGPRVTVIKSDLEDYLSR